MKSVKRIVTLLIAVVMILSLAACGGGNNKQPSATGKTSTDATQATSGEKTNKSTDNEPEEIPVIRVNYHCIFDTWEAVDEVQDALNELLRERANAELEIVIIPTSDLKQQTNLLLTGSPDSLISAFLSYSTTAELYSNGQVIALDELLESDGEASGAVQRF